MQTAQQLAEALINTKGLPAGLGRIRELAAQARAYHGLNPYPAHWFADWKTEDRGPLPRCLPIARSVVRRGARWLFSRPLTLQAPGNERLESYLREVWRKNRMQSRLRAIAQDGALDGGVVLKFAFDPDYPERPVTICSLSLVDEVRLFYHPHDRDQLLMARIQYRYWDGELNATCWYREEWTAAREVHYHPVKAEDLGRAGDPDTYEGWVIDSEASRPNPFGLVPLVHIRNLDTDDQWGAGDLWEPEDEREGGLYRVLDRIHLTYHLMDRSNQFDADTNPIFIDADVDEEDVERPLAPGEGMSVHSRQAGEGGQQAKIVFPPTGNALRPAMMEYARDLKKQVLSAAGSVEVDQAEFSNKGNLTTAVLEQLYQPQIELTEEKRQTYGADGLALFLTRMAQGLQRAGVSLGVTADEESCAVEIQWPAHFKLSEEERTTRTERLVGQESAGYVTHDRAVMEISQMEGRDPKAVLDELEEEPPPEPDPEAQAKEETVE